MVISDMLKNALKYSCLCLMPIFTLSAGTIGTLETQVNVNIQSTCDISAPQSIFLTIPDGIATHEPFDITVTCMDLTKTAIKATVKKGVLSGDTDVRMTNGSLLRLKQNGNNVNLNKEFCITTMQGVSQCQLIPETEVAPGDKRGLSEATISFTVTYPA